MLLTLQSDDAFNQTFFNADGIVSFRQSQPSVRMTRQHEFITSAWRFDIDLWAVELAISMGYITFDDYGIIEASNFPAYLEVGFVIEELAN